MRRRALLDDDEVLVRRAGRARDGAVRANPADNQGWAFISLMNDMTPSSWGFVTSMNDKPAEHPKLVVVAANCP